MEEFRSNEEAGRKNFTWHDLRYTFAVPMVMEGLDTNTVLDETNRNTMTTDASGFPTSAFSVRW